MANKALFSAALALGALASGAQAVKYEQFVQRNSSNCNVLPITQDIGRGVFNVSTFFVFLNGTEEINPEELARNNASEILGECSLLAVTQSIPLTPMQFARLYEDTQSALRQLDNTTFSALSNASTTLDTPPQCSAMLDAIDPAQSYFVRELEKIIGPEQTRAATTNGTADFIAEVRDTGSKTTTVAALGGNPVQYTSCANDTWDNRLIYTYTDHNSDVGGGQQRTWIAFSNKCPKLDARVTIDIVPLAEEDFSPHEYCNDLIWVNRNIQGGRIVVWGWLVCAGTMLAVVMCFATFCCTCLCPHTGCCATNFGRRTRARWERLCVRAGASWMLQDAKLHVTPNGVSRSLLMTSLCIPAFVMYQQLHVPYFTRDDIIDPEWSTSIKTWALVSDARVPIMKLVYAFQRGIGISLPAFAAMWLYFSHPRRDRDWLPKVALTTTALLVATLCFSTMLYDLLSYFRRWRRTNFHVIVQGGLVLAMIGAWIALLLAVVFKQPLSKQEAATQQLELEEEVEERSAPLVAPVISDPHGKAVPRGARSAPRDFVPRGGNKLSLAALTAQLNITTTTTTSTAGSSKPAAPPPQEAEEEQGPWNDLADADEKFRTRWKRRWAALRTKNPAVELARLPRYGWNALKEEGIFRYSPYFSAALIVAFVILTASFANSLQIVDQVAKCTLPESACIRNVQRWIFENVIAGPAGGASLDAVGQMALACQAAAAARNQTAADGGTPSVEARLDAANPEKQLQCRFAIAAWNIYDSGDNPQWVLDAETPVRIGGKVGFLLAYLLGIYTILHIAHAYKRFILKVACVEDLKNKKRTKPYGADPIQDFSTARIGKSSYFAGMLVSTCWVQLWWAGITLSLIFAALLHPEFWRVVWEHKAWPISVAVIFLWHILSQKALNRWVTPGTEIKRPLLWFFCYALLSTVYFTVGILLSLQRVVQLYFTTMIAMSRLERSLFTIFARADRGYASFLAMVLMVRVLDLRAALDAKGHPSELDGSDGSQASDKLPGALPAILEAEHSAHGSGQNQTGPTHVGRANGGGYRPPGSGGGGYRPASAMGGPGAGDYQSSSGGGPQGWAGSGPGPAAAPPPPPPRGRLYDGAQPAPGGAYTPAAHGAGYRLPSAAGPQRQSGAGGYQAPPVPPLGGATFTSSYPTV